MRILKEKGRIFIYADSSEDKIYSGDAISAYDVDVRGVVKRYIQDGDEHYDTDTCTRYMYNMTDDGWIDQATGTLVTQPDDSADDTSDTGDSTGESGDTTTEGGT